MEFHGRGSGALDGNSGDDFFAAGPAPIGAAIPAAVAAAVGNFLDATTPTEQKKQLEARILAVVNDPDMHRSVAGRAADLIVHHGVPMAELQKIFNDVQVMRDTGNLRNVGGFFNHKARELAERHGVPWPAAKGDQTEEGET